jgi:hypothetical protein
MSKLTKAEVGRIVRAFWKTQEVPEDSPKPRRSARPAQKLATDWLRSTGFDLKKAETLQKQQRADFDRMAPKAAAAAARRWAGHIKRTQRSAAAWGASMMATSAAAPPSDSSFFLAQPINILASDPGMLKESHIEPGNSFAKMFIDRRSSDVDTLSFIFGFHNGAATPFIFDFDTLLNASGHLRMSAGAGFINSGDVFLDAKLDVLTSSQISDSRNVVSLGSISDGPPFFGGETTERTFALTRFLTAPGIVVESDQIAILLVSLVVKYDLDDAHVVADLNTGNFRVLCPVVLAARRPLPAKASNLVAAGLTI